MENPFSIYKNFPFTKILILEMLNWCWFSIECLERADALELLFLILFLYRVIRLKIHCLISSIYVPTQSPQFILFTTLISSFYAKMDFNLKNKFFKALFHCLAYVLLIYYVLMCYGYVQKQFDFSNMKNLERENYFSIILTLKVFHNKKFVTY